MRLRVSGDGRNSSSRTHFVILTLTVMLEETVEYQCNFFDPDDCIAIGIYEGKESRDDVSKLSLLFICSKLTNNFSSSLKCSCR